MLAIVLRSAPRAADAPRCRKSHSHRRKVLHMCGGAAYGGVRRLAIAEATAMHFLFEAFPSSFPHYFVMDTYLVMISDEFLWIQTFKDLLSSFFYWKLPLSYLDYTLPRYY